MRSLLSTAWQVVSDTVDRGFESAEKGLDNLIDKGDKVTKAYDNISSTIKDVSRNGVQRNHIDDLHENKKIIEENMPQDITQPRVVKSISRVIDTTHIVTQVVDKVQENKIR